MTEPALRRPIAARDSRWAPRISRWLIARGLTPNQVSCLSMLFATIAAVAVAASADVDVGWRIGLLILTAVCIQLRLLCNLFDGLMAVEGGLASPTGQLFNDVPDRYADAVVLIAAGCAVRQLEYALTLGWVAALLAVFTAYVRVLGAAGGVGHDFSGPMAKQQRMVVVTFACIASTLDGYWNGEGQILRAALAIVVVGCVVTIVRRLARIARALHRKHESPA